MGDAAERIRASAKPIEVWDFGYTKAHRRIFAAVAAGIAEGAPAMGYGALASLLNLARSTVQLRLGELVERGHLHVIRRGVGVRGTEYRLGEPLPGPPVPARTDRKCTDFGMPASAAPTASTCTDFGMRPAGTCTDFGTLHPSTCTDFGTPAYKETRAALAKGAKASKEAKALAHGNEAENELKQVIAYEVTAARLTVKGLPIDEPTLRTLARELRQLPPNVAERVKLRDRAEQLRRRNDVRHWGLLIHVVRQAIRAATKELYPGQSPAWLPPERRPPRVETQAMQQGQMTQDLNFSRDLLQRAAAGVGRL